MTFPDIKTRPTLPAETHLGATTLRVADLARSIDFYTRVIGLKTLEQDGQNAIMGVAQRPLLKLQELKNARRQPGHSTGLYHVAILTPSRADLGRVVLNLARTQYPLGGYSDHLVSEAFYLDDPDGNGLELYRDRPRSEWKWNNGQVEMANAMIDLDGIIASVEDPEAPYTGMADDTVIGHMHLRVADLAKTKAFYSDVMGFDVVADWPSALFMSAGGYHHHLGTNTWHSRNAPRPPADSVGLLEYTVILPNVDDLNQLAARFKNAGIDITAQDGDLLVDDPSGNRIRIKS